MRLIQATNSFNAGNPLQPSFSSNTQPGSLLVCTIGAAVINSSPVTVPVISAPTTPAGYANPWKFVVAEDFLFGTYAAETSIIYYIPNAPEMLSTMISDISGTFGSGSTSFGCQLLEFSSDIPTPYSTVGAGGNAPTPASAGNITLKVPGVVLCFVTDPFYNTEFVAGAGYTGISTGGLGSGYGYAQYRIGNSAGSYPTAYGTSISGGWCEVAVAFGGGVVQQPNIWISS